MIQVIPSDRCAKHGTLLVESPTRSWTEFYEGDVLVAVRESKQRLRVCPDCCRGTANEILLPPEMRIVGEFES